MSEPRVSRTATLALLAVISLVVGVLVVTRPVKQAELVEETVPRVEVESIRRLDLQPVEEMTGRLHPARTAALRFEVSGELVERGVEPGQEVGPGDLLLRLEEGDYADAVTDAEAALDEERAAARRDRALLELARGSRELQAREVERLGKLGRDSLASASRLDEARQRLLQLQADEARLGYSVDTAGARLAKRRAGLDRARRNLARTRLTAPFAGTVNAVHAEVGDYLTPGSPALVLVRDQTLDLHLEVTGEVLAALELGQEITLMAADESRRGTLVSIQVDPDPRTHTHPVEVRASADGLLPGMLATARLPLKPLHGALVAPLSAILRDEGRSFLFVINGDRLQRRPVTLGRRMDGLQVIRAGVAEGDIVVARDVAALSHGQRVQPLQSDPRD